MLLSWDYDGLGAAAAASDGDVGADSRPGLNAICVRPPADRDGASADPSDRGWSELLGGADLSRGVLELYRARAISADSSGWNGAPMPPALEQLRHALRQLLVQLGSVHHRLFASAAAMAEHAQTLLTAAAHLCAHAPPGDATGVAPSDADASLLDGAVLVQRLISCIGVERLVAMAEPWPRTLCALLHDVACGSAAAAAAAAAATEERGRVAEAHDVAIDAWVSLLTQASSLGILRRSPLLGDSAASVFRAVVVARRAAAVTAAAAECADDWEDHGEADADEVARLHERMIDCAY